MSDGKAVLLMITIWVSVFLLLDLWGRFARKDEPDTSYQDIQRLENKIPKNKQPWEYTEEEFRASADLQELIKQHQADEAYEASDVLGR